MIVLVRPAEMTSSRRSIAVVLIALAALALAIAALLLVVHPGGAREIAPGVWDGASLPEHLSVCGRSYRHDALDRRWTASEIEARQGFPPTVVQPVQVQPCIPGPCTDVADLGPCDTVVYVQVGADAYVDYALQGGP